MNYHLNIRTAQDSDVEPILCKENFIVIIFVGVVQYEIYENFHHTKITRYMYTVLSWALEVLYSQLWLHLHSMYAFVVDKYARDLYMENANF